jgi:hypothetical protein
MARRQPSSATLRALLAKSGNQCAYPGCVAELVTADNLYVGELCHIEAAEPGGPRYNANSTNEDRRAYANLILFCHAHHRRVDSDPSRFTPEWLREIKASHETGFLRNPFKVDESVIYQMERDIEEYWNDVLQRRDRHPIAALAVRLDIDADGLTVFKHLAEYIERLAAILDHLSSSDDQLPSELRAFLQRIGYDVGALDTVPYYENPFDIRNWETHNIGARNVLRDLRATALHAELLYLVEHVKLHPNNLLAKNRLADVKEEIAQIASSWGYAD